VGDMRVNLFLWWERDFFPTAEQSVGKTSQGGASTIKLFFAPIINYIINIQVTISLCQRRICCPQAQEV